MKKQLKFVLLLLGVSIAFWGCKKDDLLKENESQFKKMVKEMGGKKNLAEVEVVRWTSVGVASEFQEDPEPINGKVADFSYDLLYKIDGSQSMQSWSVQTDYAYESDFSFLETVDGTNGKSVGVTGFFSENFGSFGVTGDPMFSTKIAARHKTLFMSSPLSIVKMITDLDAFVGPEEGMIYAGFNLSTRGFGSSTPDIVLVIDPTTELPESATVTENDPLYGDVVYEVRYGDWREVDDIMMPHTLEHVLDGNTIRTEVLSNIEIDPAYDSADLTVSNSDAWAYDVEEAEAGHLSSQFHFRTLLQTFAIDFPVEYTSATSPLALPSETVANDVNVYRVSGDFQSHYTYAFNVGGSLVIYDSPINNRRSAAVLAQIRSDFSTAPIQYVVNSHNHFDHIGGTRGNLAEGGSLIVGSGSETEMTDILNNAYTVLPNPISSQTVSVIGLSDSLTIGTGQDQIILYTVETEHAETHDYVIIYKPFTKTIWSNDMYNPGFINILASTTPGNQVRLKALAQDLVDFVDGRGLEVTTSYCSHGFTTQDFDFANVRALAAM